MLQQISRRVTSVREHQSELSSLQAVLSQQQDGPSEVPLQLAAWGRLAPVGLPSGQRECAILENAAFIAGKKQLLM